MVLVEEFRLSDNNPSLVAHDFFVIIEQQFSLALDVIDS